MQLWQHFTVSSILAVALLPFLNWYSLFIFVGGFLIDADHPLYYLIKFKSANLMKAYHYFRKIGDTKDIKEYKKVIRPFHNIESLAILGIVSFFHPIFLAILIGYVAHIIMDIIDELRVFGSIENISIIMFLYKRSKQKAL